MSESARAASRAGPAGAVITVGTFDGVHRGHLALIERLQRHARDLGLPSVAVTFEPHPLEVVRPGSAPRLLTTPAEKLEIFAQVGIDRVVFLRFDRVLASYEPRRFVEEILVGRLGLAYLVTGYDHGFGRDRSGDAAMLQRIGDETGFGVDVVQPELVDGEPVSSSAIRHALAAGDVTRAATLLDRPYSLTGIVVRGEGRGRNLGFPTANLALADPRKLLPLEGIYTVIAETRRDRLRGLLHLGPRPVFGDDRPTIEFHALGFDGNLYGERVRVAFCERVRDIAAYGSTAELIRAMQEDREVAEARFAAGTGACADPATPLHSRA